MKYQINIISICVLMLVSFSCTDVSVTPKSSTTGDVVFQDPNSYKAFLAKLYAGLAVSGQEGPAGNGDISGIDEGFSSYLRQYWGAQELSTDEAVIAWGDEGLPDFHEHSWTSSNQFVSAMYNRIYFQVSQTNQFLRETTDQKLESRGVDTSLRDQIQTFRAEARFLRALSYWHGIDMYGDIPLVTEDFDLGISAPEQSTRQEVFNFIEQELLDIESALPAPKQGEYGRADQAAVWSLLTKLYLNAEVYVNEDRYTDAVTFANKIINSNAYSLDPTFRNLFRADNHTASGIIFPITFDGKRTQTFGGMTFIIHAAVGGSMDPATLGIDGGWFGTRTTKKVVDLYPDQENSKDSRAIFFTDGQSLEINSITDFTDGYAVPKFTNISSTGAPGSDPTFPDTDFPMFRLADIYLMYAEAVLRGGSGGNEAQALQFINDIRERAYGDQSGNITSSELTLDFIKDERARELKWETHRRTDLIRFDEFTENGIWPWKGGVKEGRTTERFRNLYPIPASELIANPNLDQNPGY